MVDEIPKANVMAMGDDELTEYLKDCSRAGSWTAPFGDRVLVVGRKDFVSIADNHCYKGLGSKESIVRKVNRNGLLSIHLGDEQEEYDIVVVLHHEDQLSPGVWHWVETDALTVFCGKDAVEDYSSSNPLDTTCPECIEKLRAQLKAYLSRSRSVQ